MGIPITIRLFNPIGASLDVPQGFYIIYAFNGVFISNIQLWCYNEGVGNLWYADCIVI